MKLLKSFLIISIAFSFSAMAQTAEELVEEAKKLNNQFFDRNSDKNFRLLEKSIALYEEARKKGHPEAEQGSWTVKYNLMIKYRSGDYTDCFVLKPITTELSEQNIDIEKKAEALLVLGLFSQKGECARKDPLKALEMFGQAGDIGDLFSCYRYSDLKDEMDSKSR